KDGKKAFLFCPDGVVSALKQPFFSKNSKKDKHQNDVCLQSETLRNQGFLLLQEKTEKV
ncbi:hypothetical protein HO427_09230, partial [Streptococcus suis]|nr:hypothetical protein [Streptococcus suis]